MKTTTMQVVNAIKQSGLVVEKMDELIDILEDVACSLEMAADDVGFHSSEFERTYNRFEVINQIVEGLDKVRKEMSDE